MRRAWLVCLWLTAAAVRAATFTVPVVADTNLSAYPTERPFNYGASAQLRIKGIEMFALYQFDLAALRGQRVTSARFVFTPKAHKLKTLGFSTIAADWTEGTRSAAPGGTCWLSRGLPDGSTAPWAQPGGDFTDVAWTQGGTCMSYGDVRERGEGWLEAPVAPELVAALLAGNSCGLCVSDEKGQTRFNNDLFSREQRARAPYLLVEAEPAPLPAVALGPLVVRADNTTVVLEFGVTCAAPERLPVSLTANGLAVPRWQYQRLEAGTNRWPLDGLPANQTLEVALQVGDARSTTRLRREARRPPPPLHVPADDAQPAASEDLFAVPAWCSVHPVTGNVLDEVGAAAYGAAPGGHYRRLNPVWSRDGVRLRVHPGETAFVQLVARADGSVPLAAASATIPGLAKSLGRLLQGEVWYVQDGLPKGEVMVPLSYPLQTLPGRRYRARVLGWAVDAEAPAGVYRGTCAFAGRTVPLTITVSRWQRAVVPRFTVSLNTYGRPLGQYGVTDEASDAAIAVEHSYFRLASELRLCYQPLSYSHSGKVDWGGGPKPLLDGTFDWTDFDRRFGPLLDGTALGGRPLPWLYLPLNENFPASMGEYAFKPSTNKWPDMLVEHALLAPPIAEALPASYRQRFQSGVDAVAQHVQAKHWDLTQFQCYFNNKYDYKDPRRGGRGTSWWWLDEPAHRDDWLALDWYMQLFESASRRALVVPHLVFRADISRPQWQRQWVWPVDHGLLVYGNDYYRYRRRSARWRSEYRTIWTYGTANPVGVSNAQSVAWCLNAWLNGADGVVPWQTVGTARNFATPDATALILPCQDGPVPSLRLLALAAGASVAEDLAHLAEHDGRERAVQCVAPLLNLNATDLRRDEDAGRLDFANFTPDDLDRVQRALWLELEP